MKEQEDDEASFPGKLLNLWLHFGKMILSCSPKYLLNNLWAQQGQPYEVYVFIMISWLLREKNNLVERRIQLIRKLHLDA